MTTAVDPDLDEVAAFQQLTAAKQALSRDLLCDPATMAYGLDRDWVMRPHLRVIGEAMADVLAGLHDRLLIICPTQVGKSTLVGEWGPFWWFCHRPKDDIAITSYSAHLAWRRSKAVRERVIQYGAEYGLFLRQDSTAKDDWSLTTGGHVRAVGVGGGLTGDPANKLLVDDPHAGRAEAESPIQRAAVHDWWSAVALKRLQPDVGVVVAILTRFHPDDWAGRRLKEEGRIEEGGRWKVVHLPAVADPKFGKDPLGRAPGEPLPHPKIPARDRARMAAWWADRKRTSTVRDWHAIDQGDPQPTEGALVSEDLLRLIRDSRTEVEAQKIAVAVDPSGGGRDVAGVVGGFRGADKRLWITHDRSDVMSSADWSREACLLAVEIDAAIILVENNYGGDMAELAIRTAWDQLQRDGKIPAGKLPPRVQPVRAKVGKLLRAEPVAQQMVLDRVRFRGLFVDLEREWATWQPTDVASPGRIDASVILAYGLLEVPGASSAVSMPQGRLPSTGVSPLGGGGSPFGPLG